MSIIFGVSFFAVILAAVVLRLAVGKPGEPSSDEAIRWWAIR